MNRRMALPLGYFPVVTDSQTLLSSTNLARVPIKEKKRPAWTGAAISGGGRYGKSVPATERLGGPPDDRGDG
jgi:hypothetical protein